VKIMRNYALALAGALLLAALIAPASAQVTQKQGGKPAAASGQTQTPGMSFLTEQECRNLGGAVHTAPQCKKTGTRCVIRLAGGQVNAPCIDEVAKK
jgi:hypothetical protein